MTLFPKEHVFELRTVFNVSLQAISVKQWESGFSRWKLSAKVAPGTKEEKNSQVKV